MALLLSKLYEGKVLNDEHRALLYSWMQNTSEEDFIPPSVPKNTKLYHKAGYLADRIHDVAIVDNGTTPFVIVIYSKSYTANYDYSVGKKMFAQVMTAAQGTFK